MDKLSINEKKQLIKKHTPSTRHLKTCFFAFLFGGAICAIGECERLVLVANGVSDKDSFTFVSLSFITLSVILTALGAFDRIARVAGAGTLVPITGFANSVCSEALDSRYEGIVLGVGAKIFTVAGPVLLFGLASGVLYGIIYYITISFM